MNETWIPPRQQQTSYELEISLFLVLILAGIYVAYDLLAEPAGGHPFGHWLGIVGTLLMITTETLYSIRKRTPYLNWTGPVRYWLSIHIVTGIVGPFLILMHTGLRFRGLAGITALLTLIVVLSGFIGRYLYTAVPHHLGGAAHTQRELQAERESLQMTYIVRKHQSPAHVQAVIAPLEQPSSVPPTWLAIFGRRFYRWQDQRRIQQALHQLKELSEKERQELAQIMSRKKSIERQMARLSTARQWLRWWHLIHVPLGLTLFFSVAVHVIATVYFRAGILAP